jgi:hypothetical protein
MNQSHPTLVGQRILEKMIALASCSKLHRILVAGSKSVELMLELERNGYIHVAATANCGRPAEQYDVVFVDWRRRTLRALETTLDWLTDCLSPEGVLVVWADPQKPAARDNLRKSLENRGFVIEAVSVRDDGSGVSARRRDVRPIRQAA